MGSEGASARRLDAVILMLAVGAAVGASSACGAATPPRNLVVITLDTMRADRLPPYGFAGVATPTLDRLAAEGVVFEETFAAVPLTLPSHASLFTGWYPQRLGVGDNAGAPLAPELTTLAEMLRAAGLTTAAFVASGVLAADRGLDQGFDLYEDPIRACPGNPRPRRRADEVIDSATSWISRHDTNPFFIWVHLFDTHRPYDLPADYGRLYADPYLAAIAFEDAQLARLIDHLERHDRLDETLIVVTGDHGESLGDHGEVTHGIFLYQEALHVPFIMRAPQLAPRRVPAVTRLVDVTPTVLSLFGLPALAGDGADLTGLLRGAVRDPGLEVYAESTYPQRFGWSALRSLRADRYKVISAPRPELYDLDADPRELRNLFEERRSVGRAMLARLDDFRSKDPRGNDRPAAATAGPDVAIAERLAALGYAAVNRSAPSHPSGGLADPKDHIATFNQMALQGHQAGGPIQPPRCDRSRPPG